MGPSASTRELEKPLKRMAEEQIETLSGLTDGLSESEIRELMFYLCVYDLKHDEEIITEGKHADSMFILSAGTLSVLVGKGKNQVEVAKVTPGNWVGDVTMLDPGPASATVRVFVKTTVYEFSHKALMDFAKAHPPGAIALLEHLSAKLATDLHRTSDAVIKRDQWKLKLAGAAGDDDWVRKTLGGQYRKGGG